MAQETVTGTAVRATFERTSMPTVQNLGPSPLYVLRKSGVTDANGIKVPVDASLAFEVPMNQTGGAFLHMVAGDDGNGVFECDVRLDPAPHEVV